MGFARGLGALRIPVEEFSTVAFTEEAKAGREKYLMITEVFTVFGKGSYDH